jgi:multisubunit Na+/H+ antiporter MnhG subunit
MSQVRIAEKKRFRGLWPLAGLIMIIALGIISYFLAPAVIDFTRRTLRGFTTAGMAPEQLRLIFTVLIFVVLASFSGLVIAIAAPKRSMQVKEKDLIKERQKMAEQKKYERVRQRRLNIETKKQMRKQ